MTQELGHTNSLVTDATLLTNLQTIEPILLNGVGGPVMIKFQGTFGSFDTAYYLPDLGIKLVSQHQLITNGFTIHYDNDLHIYQLQR